MHHIATNRRFIASLFAGSLLGLPAVAAAQPAFPFAEAFDTAQAQAPANLVLEVSLVDGGTIWESDTLAPGATSLLDIEISAATGAVLEVDTEAVEPGMAAIASAFAAASTTWAEAIAVAGTAFPGTWIREMELEFAGGQLVFETIVVDASGPFTFNISAATGEIIGSTPSGPCVGAVDLLAAAIAVEAEFPGLPVIEVETQTSGGATVFEVEFADPATQTVQDVEITAAEGCFDEAETLSDEPWAEVAAILALLPGATVDRATAVAQAEAETGGTAFEWEYEIQNGQLFHEVDVLTASGPVTVLVNAVTGGSGGGGEPGGDVVLVGALEAWAIGQDATPTGFPLETELEFVGGAFIWETELIDGGSLVEHDIDAATGAIIETDVDAADADDLAVQAAFATTTIPTAEAVAIAVAEVPGGFVYEIDREQAGGAPRYEIGLVTQIDRLEVEIDAVTGTVLAVTVEGPAQFIPDADGPGVIPVFSLSPGDVNGDDIVDTADILTVLSGFGTTGGAADADFDGDVDIDDLLLVLANFGLSFGG